MIWVEAWVNELNLNLSRNGTRKYLGIAYCYCKSLPFSKNAQKQLIYAPQTTEVSKIWQHQRQHLPTTNTRNSSLSNCIMCAQSQCNSNNKKTMDTNDVSNTEWHKSESASCHQVHTATADPTPTQVDVNKSISAQDLKSIYGIVVNFNLYYLYNKVIISKLREFYSCSCAPY